MSTRTWKQALHFPVRIGGVAFSPDGTRIALGTGRHIQVHEVQSSALLWKVDTCSHNVHALFWSPDGNTIASTGSGQMVQVWGALAGDLQRSLPGHTQEVIALAWSPDGARLASADRTEVQVWGVQNGRQAVVYSPGRKEKHPLPDVGAVAWSPDGKRIALGVGTAVLLYAFPTSEGEKRGPLFHYRQHEQSVKVVAWCPDGSSIASGGDDTTVHVWKAGPAQGSHPFAGVYHVHHGSTQAACWSPDGRVLCTAGGDGVDNTVMVWEPNWWYWLRNQATHLL